MSPKYLNLLFTLLFLLLAGCSSESGRVSGTHFQGKDCLHCHNVDLKEDSHLAFGATLFQEEPNEANYEDPEMFCNIPLFLQLKKIDSSIVYDSRNTNTTDDPGFNGDGNVFALLQKQAIPDGSYLVSIINKSGDTLLDSAATHTFNRSYDADKTDDDSNRYSCNACHRIDARQAPLSIPTTCRN